MQWRKKKFGKKTFHERALLAMQQEYDTHNAAVSKAREAARDASGALGQHREDAARRIQAHETEVRRTRQQSKKANSLRDMNSRSKLEGGDEASLRCHVDSVHQSASAATEAVTRAEVALDATRSVDNDKLMELSRVASKTVTNLEQRTRVCQNVAERMKLRESSALEARREHAKAKAAVQAVSEELEVMRSRSTGPLTEAKNQTEACAEAAREFAQEARQASASKEAPLRHAEEAEALVVQKMEEAEAKLLQSLSAARTAVAEAEADARLNSGDAAQQHMSQVSLVQLESQARLQDQSRDTDLASVVVDQAEQALHSARRELQDLQTSLMDHGDDGDILKAEPDQCAGVAVLLAAVEERERALGDASAELSQVTAAKLATEEEVAASVTSAAKHIAGIDTALLLELELVMVGDCISAHAGNQDSFKAGVRVAEVKWVDDKEGLKADLHMASLKLARAEEEMRAHEEFTSQYRVSTR